MPALTLHLHLHIMLPDQSALPTAANANFSWKLYFDVQIIHAAGRQILSALTSSLAHAGFTGADLQNLMNEAAILAARRNLKEISKEEIADALERIVAGPEKKGAVMSEKKKRLVAYHEVCCCLCISVTGSWCANTHLSSRLSGLPQASAEASHLCNADTLQGTASKGTSAACASILNSSFFVSDCDQNRHTQAWP